MRIYVFVSTVVYDYRDAEMLNGTPVSRPGLLSPAPDIMVMDMSDVDGNAVDESGSKNSTVLYAGAMLTGMTSASFVFNFVLIVFLIVKKRFVPGLEILLMVSP